MNAIVPSFASKPQSTRPRLVRLIGVMVAFGVGAILAAACGTSDGAAEATLAGYERDPEPAVGRLTLPAANLSTEDFQFKADPDELLMVSFGYTNCPDVCPTTLSDARIALNQLGPRSDEVDFAFVSIDPDRDSAEALTEYVEAFLDDGIALRTDDATELAIAADAFGVTYTVEETADGEIEVGHTPHIFLVDDTGSLILTWPFGVQANDLASDLTVLLDRQQNL